MENPLEALLIDAAAVDLERLAVALKPLVAIDTSTGNLRFLPAYQQLTTRRKVLSCLLGQKASHLLQRADEDIMSPKQIELCTGLPGGTVRAKLTELKADRLVEQENGGKYRVTPHLLSEALGELIQKSADMTA